MFNGLLLEVTDDLLPVHELREFLKSVNIPLSKALDAEQILITVSSGYLHQIVFGPVIITVIVLDPEDFLKITLIRIPDTIPQCVIVHKNSASPEVIRVHYILYRIHDPVIIE